MRNFLWILFFMPLLGFAQVKKTTATTVKKKMGHSIQITLKPYQNTKIFIGTNYGKNKVLADSCLLNEKSEGVFESKQKLTPGIYFVISPKYSILFDFLIDEEQHFKMVADTLALDNVTITGSPDNTLFQTYSKDINGLFVQLNNLQNQLKKANNKADSALFKGAYLGKDKEIKEKRNAFMLAHPKSMMSYLLNVI